MLCFHVFLVVSTVFSVFNVVCTYINCYALIKVTDKWYQNIEDGLLTGLCFFDVSKCFDAISHEILFFKLGKYGVDNNELSWFKSYLSNRTQAVVNNNNNNMSSFSQVNIGIPQGSVLGPVLFFGYG